MLEALRVASDWRHNNATHVAKPVLPYARLAFTHTLSFLNKVGFVPTRACTNQFTGNKINLSFELVTLSVFVCAQTDLMHTLGESAALGAAGVVLWGEMKFAKSKVRSVCERVIHAGVFMCVTLSVQSHSPASVHPSQRLHTHCPGSIRAEAAVQHPSLQPPALPRQWALHQETPQLGSHALLSSSRDL